MRTISFEEAKRSINAVVDQIIAGASLHPTGRTPGAISLAARELNIPRTTLACRVAPGGSCEVEHGLTLDKALRIAAAEGRMGFDPVLHGYEIKTSSVETDAEGTVTKRWVKQERAHGEAFEMPAGQSSRACQRLWTLTAGRSRSGSRPAQTTILPIMSERFLRCSRNTRVAPN